MESARDHFKRKFGFTPTRHVRVQAPLELLGHLALYEHGLALGLAVDRYWDVAVAPRTDGKIEWVSPMFQTADTFNVSRMEAEPGAGWRGVVKTLLQQLQMHGVPLRGFNAAVQSSIPPGLGLGHTAALAAALALAYRELFPYALTSAGGARILERDAKGGLPIPTKEEKIEIARACLRAELPCVGPQPSLTEPVTCLFSRSMEANELDGQSLAIEPVPLTESVGIVLCDSGVRVDWSHHVREDWRQLAQSISSRLGVSSLRAVDSRDLPAARKKLSEREFAFLAHGVGEVQRVLFGVRALREGDFGQLGQYLFQSHESGRSLNACPEGDHLVAMARSHAACLGARMISIGCGGSTVNLVPSGQEQDFMRHMARPFRNQPVHRAAPVLCRVVFASK